jgi:hypothetical protein
MCPLFAEKEDNNPYLSAEALESPINLKGHDNFNKTPIHDLNFDQEQGIDLTLCPDFNSVEDRQAYENEVNMLERVDDN